jgi:serine/threonine protein kinase
VYFATNKFNSTKVAIKILKSNPSTPDKQRFVLESEFMKMISKHPNIVHYIESSAGTYQNESVNYIVLELCRKQNLIQIIEKDGKFSEQIARGLIKEVLQAL